MSAYPLPPTTPSSSKESKTACHHKPGSSCSLLWESCEPSAETAARVLMSAQVPHGPSSSIYVHHSHDKQPSPQRHGLLCTESTTHTINSPQSQYGDLSCTEDPASHYKQPPSQCSDLSCMEDKLS
ncbi:hypothetical protein ABG768_024976 [Culter alburnus]|uniref:Uncharacterized protein n=1 Tax=Culter alburnus TaxID=194366 RepID=A0AAW2AGA3_CULAL